MKPEKISELTTNRLSIYLRCLNDLADHGQKTVSSDALAKIFHLNSAQIRKDLAHFGELGVRGVGYHVDELRDNLTKILGLDKTIRVCIIGSGRLGTALADYHGFRRSNFVVTALFDSDPKKIGKKIAGITISDMKSFSSVIKKDSIEVAVIAVPAERAQKVLDKVTKAGIKAVLNFAPIPLKVSGDVKLNTVDLTSSLESLSFFLTGATELNESDLKPISRSRRK